MNQNRCRLFVVGLLNFSAVLLLNQWQQDAGVIKNENRIHRKTTPD
ncbi:hypothetical protein CSC12_3731 [Klebsiella michiganensis]|nr:hypothetical protein CSC12_3731 [Klebsiella michiganensis]